MKAFCTAVITPEYRKILESHMEVKYGGNPKERQYLTEAQMAEELQDADVLILGYEFLTKELIKHAPKLKLVASERDGPEENIDVAACTEAGIPVVHSCGRCINPVGEHTFTLMLALARQFPTEVQMVREGYWDPSNPEKLKKLMKIVDGGVDELYGATLGVVGLGRNGLNIAERGLAFGMNVIGYDPYANRETIEAKGIQLKTLDEVMQESDYFVIMARVSKDTIGMIGKREIAMMKPTARFINTARAALVDYDALYEALEQGRIAGAALDVFEKEPLGADSRWFQLDPSKVILTPHQAGISRQRDNTHSKEIVKYITQYLKGEKPASVMDKSVYERPAFQTHGALIFGVEK